MTTALTSAGIQQVSITIASGALTGTASISAVGSGAVITYNGLTASDSTAQADDTTAVITISGTTVTATRGVTGSSQTVVVNATITDFSTTNVANTVQTGTVTMTTTNTTGTATISSVTNANTGVAYLGESASASITGITGIGTTLSLSGTTLTAQRITGTTATLVTGYCVIEAKGSALNSSTQQITKTNPTSGTSTTQTITSVTVGNTLICFGGERFAGSSTPSLDFTNIQLSAATTLTYTWTSSGVLSTVSVCTVMEFVAALIKQNVQRGTISFSAQTSKTAAITSSPLAETLLNWLYNTSNATTYTPNSVYYKIAQTNATTLTMTANASATGIGSYEAIDFNPFVAATTIEYITSPEEDEIYDYLWDEDETTAFIADAAPPVATVEYLVSPEEDEVFDNQAEDDEIGFFPAQTPSVPFLVSPEEDEVYDYLADDDEIGFSVFPAAGNPVGTEAIFGSPPEEEEIRLDQADDDEPTFTPFPAAGGFGIEAMFSTPEEEEIRLDQDDEDETTQVIFAAAVTGTVEFLVSPEEEIIEEPVEDDTADQPVFQPDFWQETPEEEEIRLDAAEEDEQGQQIIIPPAIVALTVEWLTSLEEEEIRDDLGEEDEPGVPYIIEPGPPPPTGNNAFIYLAGPTTRTMGLPRLPLMS